MRRIYSHLEVGTKGGEGVNDRHERSLIAYERATLDMIGLILLRHDVFMFMFMFM